nr:reverse transcriptase domain-containing protein [Tanacetum cinerariifolium]
MVDRTIEEILQAPTEGYEEAIVILKILAENFKIKTNLLQLVQTNKFHGFERDNRHTHISNFKRMTATLKYMDVPNDAIKLMLFPYSLEGAARIWYEKEPPNLILTWDDLVNKFVNQFFLPLKPPTSKMKSLVSHKDSKRHLERLGKVLRKCLEHVPTMDSRTGGNLLSKTTREALKVNENKSKVCYSRSKSNVSTVNTNSKDSASKTDDRIDKLADQISNLVEIVNKQVITPATAKVVEKTCVICGGTLPSNIVPNLKGEMKAVTTRSGLAYEGPSIPTNSPLEKVVERDTEESMDKEHYKLFELAKVPLNENCSAMLLKKLLEKLGDSGKFLIPYDFPRIDVFHALADLGGEVPFSYRFYGCRFEAGPRVSLILGRSFLRTGHALIDVYGKEITLRVNDESVTFNLNQTMRYSSTYDDNSVNRVDVIDIDCEEFVQDVLDFQYNPKSRNPTLVSNPSNFESESCKEPIIKSSLPTLTPFGESDFFLVEIEDFLNDESIPIGIDNSFYDPEGDILYLEKFLNEDLFQLPSMDLKQAEETKAKSSIEEPPELELKELPSHFEYAFLEESDKLPVIIAKDLKDVEKEALIKEDYKLAVQSQRRANPKIHDVIKKEVIKLLDAGVIYPISDSSWVSPIYYVPKKGGMTVVANENNELIPTRLVTGWRVCIDYRKLNDDTRKDHFPLPFMDQMLERLAGNEFYCFLDGFSRNFLGHKFSKSGIEVDKAKVDVIAKLPHPTTVKGVRSFLGHVGFYRRFIQDFSKIARPMTHLLEKETPFVFSKECVDAFNTLKKKLTEAPILVVLDWNLPFELMCDASDFAIGAVLGQRKIKHFQPIHYARKTMTEAQIYYTTTEKKMLAVVYAFENFRPYLVLSKSIVYTDHSALIYLLNKQDANPRENRASWSDKLDDALWAFRTTFKTPIGCTPYKLVYGKSCHLPIELEHKAYWALKHVNFDLKNAGDHRKLQLNELRD